MPRYTHASTPCPARLSSSPRLAATAGPAGPPPPAGAAAPRQARPWAERPHLCTGRAAIAWWVLAGPAAGAGRGRCGRTAPRAGGCCTGGGGGKHAEGECWRGVTGCLFVCVWWWWWWGSNMMGWGNARPGCCKHHGRGQLGSSRGLGGKRVCWKFSGRAASGTSARLPT